MSDYLLAIDQGTTSTRAIIFDHDGNAIASSQEEFPQHYPRNGWVEHEAEDLWQSCLRTCRQALASAAIQASALKAIGISNQRETTLVWDRRSGQPLCRAIVWQDRRTSDWCRQLEEAGHGPLIRERTGLLLDPYFSASKLRWILDNVSGAAEAARRGELAFGTVDTFLLWKLTGGRSHLTDATNASRTLMFNIHTQRWDEELLELFDIPRSLLPEVMDSGADFGLCETGILGHPVPITGILGDQQAAAFGQCCFEAGMAKSTYGTGCFLVLNTGSRAIRSSNRLLTTVAYRLRGETTYALEGSIFMAGATIQWLRDGLGILSSAAESESLAEKARQDSQVYLVPAFTGLGAPYWDAEARGAVFGLTRDAGVNELAAAALLSVCYQTRDLQLAMEADGQCLTALRVDGGMSENNYVLRNLAGLLGKPVDRPQVSETTALGAAFVAGHHCGLYDSLESIATRWKLERRFEPQQNDSWREEQYAGWQDAVQRTLSNRSGHPVRQKSSTEESE